MIVVVLHLLKEHPLPIEVALITLRTRNRYLRLCLATGNYTWLCDSCVVCACGICAPEG